MPWSSISPMRLFFFYVLFTSVTLNAQQASGQQASGQQASGSAPKSSTAAPSYSSMLTAPSSKAHRRFEYKFSFKPPYLAQKDGSVPFWEYTGNAIAGQESVRITPSLRSQKGLMYTKKFIDFDYWEVELHIRVSSRNRVGADGLAFWYTNPRVTTGPVFGAADNWNGLAVIFDSFDNDAKHNNPYISVVVNDGSKNFDHKNDGATQQLAGCLRDFRNKPYPVKAKIEYFNNVLTLLIHNGMNNNDRDYELCLRVENVVLPKNGYFGVSAATGGLADDHDVLKLLTHSLHPQGEVIKPSVSEGDVVETEKFEQEFEDYQKKLKEQKEQWAKEHPDQIKNEEEDWEGWFTDNEKELNQIFQGQSDMKNILVELHRKMDDIVGRQERTLSVISGLQGGQAVAGGSGQGQAQIPIDTIRRDEVNAVLANQREIVTASRDIKNFVTDIHSKTSQLLSRGTAQPVGAVGGPTSGSNVDLSAPINEMRESLNIIRRDMGNLNKRGAGNTAGGQAQVQCPEVNQSCVSTTLFIVAAVAQIIVLISYLIYKDNREARAKKFY